jgi:septum formation protein
LLQEVDGAVMEKPKDAADAANMLHRLSGRSSHVHSGVCVCIRKPTIAGPAGDAVAGVSEAADQASAALAPLPPPGYSVVAFTESTAVAFAPLSGPMIAAYVASGEPFGKAGGYGIQGAAAQFITGLTGDYYNVMGLPLQRLCGVLRGVVEQ